MGDEERSVDAKRVEENFEKVLLTHPGIQKILTPYPIRLTPQSPYLMGRAALVFVAPHVLDPASDVAEYGWGTYYPEGNVWDNMPPHETARVVAWFRPSDAGRKYNVDFSCMGESGHSFVLAPSTGATETAELPVEDPYFTKDYWAVGLQKALVGTTFEATNESWRSFILSSDGRWRLLSFEVVQLPDS